ncbi:MAG: shikimate dehydrogenase [Ilumatobacteraceae bacterium]
MIGSPVAHSLSPALHNAAFGALGLDWVYVALEVDEGDAGVAVDAVQSLHLAGLSVTMPHKQAVADHLMRVGRLDPAAAALRSVNTVVRAADGVLEGHSTDGAGFVASLRAAGVEPTGRSVLLLGAGGAARAIADALGRAGAADVMVSNRTRSSADAAATLVTAAGSTGRVVDATPDTIAAADIVVNATSVGMGVDARQGSASALPVDPRLLGPAHVVADIVYHPRDTALLHAARSAGARVVDGLGMLVHQAALQQQLWHGSMPDLHVMTDAAERELAARRH